MSERMTRAARRDQLLRVMSSLHKQAKCREDFTAERIAEAAGGISTVWFYKLVGAEFKELCSQLEGSPPSSESTDHKHRREVLELRRKLRKLEARFKAEITGDLSGAIRHIEAQDEQIRTLESLVKVLLGRLRDRGDKEWADQLGSMMSKQQVEESTAPRDSGDMCEMSDVIDAAGDYPN